MPSHHSDPDQRIAPLALWRAAGAFLNTLYNLFGAPEQIAAQHTLTAKSYRLLLDWLRVGEAVLRRLLLLEAAAYLGDSATHRARPSPRKPRQRQLITFAAEDPEAWRVSFRCGASAPRQAKRKADAPATPSTSKPSAQAPKRFYSAWPLAERVEALLRAYNDPAPYAKRLARRLAGATARVRAVVAYPPKTPAYFGADDFAALSVACDCVLPLFDSS